MARGAHSQESYMLIRFRVANFRSLRDEQELSMVATLRGDRKDLIQVEGLGLDLVRVAGIYGANAAGKSNILDAIGFMRTAIRDSHRKWPPEGSIDTEPFILDPEAQKAPSLFEIDVAINNTRHNYGFTLNSERILKEWLYVYPNNRQQLWFKRSEHKIVFGKHLRGNNKSIEQITRPNSLFLSAAAQNNHQGLAPLYSKLIQGINYHGKLPWYSNVVARGLLDDEHRERILDLMRHADLGVGDIVITKETPNDEVRELTNTLLRLRGNSSPLPDNFSLPALELKHYSKQGLTPLNFNNESEGTRAWFAVLGPILVALERGSVLCVEELNSSLHPLLALQAIQLFQNQDTNPNNAQMIFNTHDTTILGNLFGEPSLRRDQIWFVEKDQEGASHLYPLTDFKPRKFENVERGYLQGRYGAIPFIGPATVEEDV
jgi:AAA15 family ATPase/GTPase